MTIIEKKKEKLDFYIIAYTFLVIFYPPLLPGIKFLLAFYYMAAVLLRYGSKKALQIMRDNGMYIWFFIMIALAFYGLTITIVNGMIYCDIVNIEHYIHLYNRFIVVTLVMLPCSVYLILYLKRKQ